MHSSDWKVAYRIFRDDFLEVTFLFAIHRDLSKSVTVWPYLLILKGSGKHDIRSAEGPLVQEAHN